MTREQIESLVWLLINEGASRSLSRQQKAHREAVDTLTAALAPESGGPLVVCGGCGNTAPLERDKDGWWRLTSHTGGECFSSGTFDYTGHDQPGGRLPPHDPPAPSSPSSAQGAVTCRPGHCEWDGDECSLCGASRCLKCRGDGGWIVMHPKALGPQEVACDRCRGTGRAIGKGE